MQNIRAYTEKFWKTGFIAIFLVGAFVIGNSTGFNIKPQVHVLAASTHVSPTATPTPTPTVAPITIINNIYVPTQTPTLQLQSKVDQPLTPTPTQQPTPTPTEQPTVTPTPTTILTAPPTPTSTPTPTPVTQSVTVDIDYAGERAESTYTVAITSGETAWQAVQDAVGLANIHYTDYGGSLGIFITGFNGIDASSNQYYDFQVNGTASSVGVSSYTVVNGDVLKFILTSF